MAKLNASLAFVALLSIATALKDQVQDAPEEASEGHEAPSLMQVEVHLEHRQHAEHRHKVASGSRSMRSEKMFDETQHMAAELAKGAANMAKEVAKEAAEETAEALSEASDSLGSAGQDSVKVADTQVDHPQNSTPSIEKADLEARSKDSEYLWRTLEDFFLAESFWLRLLIMCSAICLVYMLCVGGQVAAAGDLLTPELLKKKNNDTPSKIPIEAQKMGGDRRQLYDRNLNTDEPDLNEPSAFHDDRDWRRAVAGGD